MSQTNHAAYEFRPFSKKQLKVMTWWTDTSPVKDSNGIIGDGAIRSGKTMSMSLSYVIWAMERFDQKIFLMCGKTVASFRRNVWLWLKRMLESSGYTVIERRSENMVTVKHRGKENWFYIFGGQDESSQDLIQGITAAGAFFDEVALMPESFVNQATARCSVDGSKLWFNCNPRGPYHWFKTSWIDRCHEKRLQYLRFTMDDNPSLSEEKKDQYKRDYVGVFYNRYISGLWDLADGGIYDMWDADENTFLISDMPTNSRTKRYISIDYGTTNPMVFLDIKYDKHTAWIVDEYYYDSRKKRRQKTDSEYADDLEKFVGDDRNVTIILDPSATSFKVELFRRGWRVIDADNSVLDGIRITSTLIKQRRIRAERTATPNLQAERANYVWNEKAIARGEEAPLKERDHAMDAMRYFAKTIITTNNTSPPPDDYGNDRESYWMN